MKVYNFSPGPAKLDSSIISKSEEAMYNFQNTGLSILEIGHRSKEFEKLLNYSSYIVNYCYEKKLNLKIKHKDNELYLNDNNQSLNRILKYFANVKN